MEIQGFDDADFQKAFGELDCREIEGWELFTESHGVTIYRQYDKVSGLYSYKIYGTIDVAPDICSHVYLDIDYRRQWDSYVKELALLSSEEDKCILYWRVNYPWPMAHRDYVYLRQHRVIPRATGDGDVYVTLARSCTDQYSFEEKSGVIRVTDYTTTCVLTKDGEGRTKAFMHYFDNPGGSIPTMLINWAAKTGVPSFLSIMQKSCRGYPEYLAKNNLQ